MQQGCFQKCSLLTVGIRNAIITDWAKCDEATSLMQVLCNDLTFGVAAAFVGGSLLYSQEISVPCIAYELVLLMEFFVIDCN